MRLAFILIGLGVATPLAAQISRGAVRDPGAALRPDSAAAPVVLLGDTLFLISARLEPFSPRARADLLSGQLEAMLRRRVEPSAITVVDAPDHSDLVIEERSFLVTRIRTIKNVDVTIPNGLVLTSNVANYTTAAPSHGLILHATVGIGYETDWRELHRLLLGAALQTPHVLAAPAPFVLQAALGDYAVSYELNAYTEAASVMHLTASALLERILDAFAGAQIEIMTPAFTALRDGSRAALPAVAPLPAPAVGVDGR